ncbi:ribosomal-processing cysteine protease Prp [Virgibacillus ihumii]|uniref:ribosomal-processing cysteine protease Prp n=1 Tax=Virgibacillus ihumii TaxID=2686091 RepID=UPI00157DA74D|nr:ribosomal-processing cysteine protease Prp [Virgibacillus ihumii]
MINVTVFRNNKQITGFELSGHAESGPYGYDLVCAGVSSVSFGAVNAVMEMTDIELVIDQGAEGGYLRVIVPENITKEQMNIVQLLFEGMIISLETIVREYNQFIEIHNNEGGTPNATS